MNFENLFNLHENALNLRAKRVELLASNIANSDTPGFKAKDIDFNQVLKAMANKTEVIRSTNALHFSEENNVVSLFQKERPSKQPSLDGNTVDTQIESAQFAQNSIRYMTSLRFIDTQVKNMLTVIKGE